MQEWYVYERHQPFALTRETQAEVGAFLVHGFTGTPSEMRPLGMAIHAQGIDAHGILLPGMGANIEQLNAMTAGSWLDATAEAWQEHQARYARSILIGYSMGGALAVVEAVRQPPDALVLLGVPTFVGGDWRIPFLRVGKYVVRWWYPLAQVDFSDPSVRARMLQRSPDLNIDDPQVQQHIRRSVRIPTAAIDHFFRLTRHARNLLRTVTVPALIVHGREDERIGAAGARAYARRLGTWATYVELEGTHFVLTERADEVREVIATWLRRQEARTREAG